MHLFFITALWFASNAAWAGNVPHSQKVFYDLEDADNLFKEYLKEYKKSYNPGEYAKRIKLFKKSLKEINELNAKHPTTVYGITLFADLTPEEEKPYFGFEIDNNNVNFNQTVQIAKRKSVSHDASVDTPTYFDWRDKGVVTPVKDQGKCGSCTIFSAIGNIEGQYALKHKQCIALSEQYCMDCLENSTGCKGSTSIKVMRGLMDKPGCMKEVDYPYVAKVQQCHEDESKMIAKVLNVTYSIVDEDTLLQKLLEIGPLSISLTIEHDQFKRYKGNVMWCADDPTKHHALVLVGYGEENGEKYWIIKNSWGLNWGEKGYLRLGRGSNECNIVGESVRTAIVA